MNNPYSIPNTQGTVNEKPVPKPQFEIIDTASAWICLILGFVIAKVLPAWQNTLGALICFVVIYTFSLTYIKRSGFKISKRSVALYVVALLFLLGFITSGNTAIHRVLFMFELGMMFYWIYYTVGLSGKKIVGESFIFHMFNSLFFIPIRSIPYFFKGIVIRDKKGVGKKTGNTVLLIFVGLFCAIIPTGIIIALLSFDDGFMGLLSDIADAVIPTYETFGDIILTFIFAILLFGVIFGTKYQSIKAGGSEAKAIKAQADFLPEALLCAGITPILAVYVIFFISQWDYYMSAFTGLLPEGLTYANYAREGFFQLCVIAVLNTLMILFFNIFMKRSGRISAFLRKGYSILISLFTLVLIATALSKMLLYIDSYGLTQKRVYTSWLMIFLALTFILVLAKIFSKRFPLIPALVVVFIVLFSLIVIPDVDTMIAEYNVEAYISSELYSVDVDTISELGVSGVPSLIRLESYLEEKSNLNGDEKAVLNKTKEVLSSLEKDLEKEFDGVFTFNFPRRKAQKMLESKK